MDVVTPFYLVFPIRMLPIDPMHTLFLGVAKHMVWMGKNMILASHFSLIQDRVDRVRVPAGIGRIPKKIQCRSV